MQNRYAKDRCIRQHEERQFHAQTKRAKSTCRTWRTVSIIASFSLCHPPLASKARATCANWPHKKSHMQVPLKENLDK